MYGRLFLHLSAPCDVFVMEFLFEKQVEQGTMDIF